MKKIMSILLGLSLAIGAVSVVFAQDAPKSDAPKDGKKKKKKADKTDRVVVSTVAVR